MDSSFNSFDVFIFKIQNSFGNRAVHVVGRVRGSNSVSASQSIATKHVPVRYGQASHGRDRIQSTKSYRHAHVLAGLSATTHGQKSSEIRIFYGVFVNYQSKL